MGEEGVRGVVFPTVTLELAFGEFNGDVDVLGSLIEERNCELVKRLMAVVAS
jgi:hypothetical protein